MTGSRKKQTIIELDPDMRFRSPSGYCFALKKVNKGPPQLYCKLLLEGADKISNAFMHHAGIMGLFFECIMKMNEHNIFRLSLEEIMQKDEIGYQPACRKMSALCKADLICRTGHHSVWMVNPHIAVKCSEDASYDLQMKWHDLWDGIAKRKAAKKKAAKLSEESNNDCVVR